MLIGIIRRLGGVPVLCAMRSATGMKMATTPVELITAPSTPTASISSTRRRVPLLPARSVSRSPIRCATPVRTSPSPITKRVAIRMTLGSVKPASDSPMLMTPVKGSRVSISRATASIRGRLAANITMAVASRARTTARSEVIRAPGQETSGGPPGAAPSSGRRPRGGAGWLRTGRAESRAGTRPPAAASTRRAARRCTAASSRRSSRRRRSCRTSGRRPRSWGSTASSA